ncbi:MAG: hypothetical protein WC356_01345 [Candidatus Micrarchaeia archaeon]|jgi:hypothetical protein
MENEDTCKIETKIDEILKWIENEDITVKDIKNRYGFTDSEIHKLLDILKESGLIEVSYSLLFFNRTKLINPQKKINKKEKKEEDLQLALRSERSIINLKERIKCIKKDTNAILIKNKKRLEKAKKEKKLNNKEISKIKQNLDEINYQIKEIDKNLKTFENFIINLKKGK